MCTVILYSDSTVRILQIKQFVELTDWIVIYSKYNEWKQFTYLFNYKHWLRIFFYIEGKKALHMFRQSF